MRSPSNPYPHRCIPPVSDACIDRCLTPANNITLLVGSGLKPVRHVLGFMPQVTESAPLGHDRRSDDSLLRSTDQEGIMYERLTVEQNIAFQVGASASPSFHPLILSAATAACCAVRLETDQLPDNPRGSHQAARTQVCLPICVSSTLASTSS